MSATTSKLRVPDLQDIIAPEHVEVVIDKKRKTIWINVDGVCRLRACRCGTISVLDDSQLREQP